MNEFVENLKREASANPTLTLIVATGLLTAAGKFIESAGHARGSAAYAKDVERRIKASKR
jgi:ethanolamine ammonia-lyase small subunit